MPWDKEEPCVYHKACWEYLNKPEHDSPSSNACDQGYFLDEDDIPYYQMKEPNKED